MVSSDCGFGPVAETMPSALVVVELLAAYHSLLLAAFVGLRRISIPLALMYAVFALHMLVNLGAGFGLMVGPLDVSDAFGLFYGPLFYLFVRGLVYAEGQPRWRDALHGLPGLAVAVFHPPVVAARTFGFVALVIYVLAAYRALRRHRSRSPQLRSDDLSVDLRWVHRSILVFAAVALFDIARSSARAVGQLAWAGDEMLALILIVVVGLLSTMAWRSTLHRQLHGEIEAADQTELANADKAADYQTLFAVIDQVVESRQLWREPRLSLNDVAEACGLHARDVSGAINGVARVSFSDYINAARVDAFDRLLGDPNQRQRALLELAFEVGFNSKSAFNRIYSKLRGRTPTAALRELRSADEAPVSRPES